MVIGIIVNQRSVLVKSKEPKKSRPITCSNKLVCVNRESISFKFMLMRFYRIFSVQKLKMIPFQHDFRFAHKQIKNALHLNIKIRSKLHIFLLESINILHSIHVVYHKANNNQHSNDTKWYSTTWHGQQSSICWMADFRRQDHV